ncbi:BatD family protein [Flavobacterium sp. NRK F10]|uniref:BatD family protein n=1 Tax=Flavobacterium sp. NRK F10 TaxID=2954931 RepID=UPI0020906C78|nr:BatD family protein [Flavobacterium sp. NRK F10]MCO6174670.1 BatD family protein [Flavobacterium sp. NRK F10]
MKKLLFYILILFQMTALAQEVKFEAKLSKSSLGLNEKLQVTFSINQDGDNFQAPSFDGFNVVGGPFQSTNFSWVNGVKSFNRSYSFVLQPKQKGTLTIKSATIEYGGEVYKTQPVKVKVTNAVELPKDPNSPDYKAGEGIHLVAEVSKGNPYLNEPITVVYKLYFDPRFSVRNVREIENPKYNGFWSQHIDIDKLRAVQGTYNGQDYAMVVWRKVLLYPQETGVKQLEPLKIELDVDVPVRKRMGGFFEMMDYETTSKTVSAGAKSITVKPLPEDGKPADFTGAVGSFDFQVKPSKNELKSGESLDLEISVTGNGNLKLFNLPKPEFPSAFEAFEPQHQENVNTPLSGMTGKISDTYTIVPQYKGKYTIKPISFSYFDLDTQKYKTITSKEVDINVTQGAENTAGGNNAAVAKQEVVKNNTFQFIKLNTVFTPLVKEDFFGTTRYYLYLLLPFALIPFIILGRKKKEAIDADVVGNRIRRNNKLAKKYLSEAKKQMKSKVSFYMAMEKALHNFLKAKLHLETSEMSKENIQELLLDRNANTNTVSDFIQLMNDCEFARYTPSSDVAMQKDYDKAVSLISELEKQL